MKIFLKILQLTGSIIIGTIIAVTFVEIFNPSEPSLFVKFSFTLLFLISIIFLIFLHEIGHAFAAQLLGMEVFKIIIGKGRKIFSFKILRWNFEFRKLPTCGLTIAADNKERFYRTRFFIMVFAGPAVSMVFLALFFIKSCRQTLPPEFFLANLYILMISLWPKKIKTARGMQNSDGLTLIKLPFFPKEKVREHLAAFYSLKGADFRKSGKWHDARLCYEEGISRFPGNVINMNDMAVLYIETGELDKALEILRPMERDETDDLKKALFRNNIAYSCALTSRRDLIEEADLLSAELVKQMPGFPSFKGTRGTVLVELGNFEKGIFFLKQAFDAHEESDAKAACACYLAIAEMRLGDHIMARKYFDSALTSNTKNFLLERTAKVIGIA